jgi:Flp pilus assembly protein TadD
MYRELAELLRTEALTAFEGIPGASFDSKIEFVANVLGITGFALSAALLMFGVLFRSGRRRPASRADLDRLSAAVVKMIGDRIADQLAEAAISASGRAPVVLDGQQGDTYARVRDDLIAAVTAITATPSDEADAAAAALINGETGPAERLLDQQAVASRNNYATAVCAEALHLKAALQATHDPAGALGACEEAVRIAPHSASGWNRLGHLYLRLGRVNEARAAFDRGLEIQAQKSAMDNRDRRSMETAAELATTT